MAKSVPHRGPDPAKKVKEAVQQLRDYHARGRASLAQHQTRAPYRGSSESLRKARIFARRYTDEELEELVNLCKKHKTALGRTFVDRLATVVDKRSRRSLQLRVVRDRWSRIMLDREILRQFGRRLPLGRAPHHAKSVDDALSEILRLSVKLTRWGKVMGWDAETGRVRDVEGLTLDDLPDDVAQEAKAALRAVRRLQEAVEAKLGVF